ncbi:putative wax ester synthase/diacylglycerol acyltransferase [Gordonia hirsuta DSM 44140 = NBRC 16056]|uniref:Diacylglycerol O-acyltransferase n=1 Tax=Gordonia hirsuta DSM 44140 = NBRC 16056 TaxID=1121927 RepID=L7LD08_9ACTN|nr:wax ester/triacylglycerol synthase family O-acyltransferase [Gordonia hirsuta]GAC58990.1 putative wax ester synthase/diacylglycerol acyltransferase [Gordonia hirsuta DSM 44140 = NBRC 16056]
MRLLTPFDHAMLRMESARTPMHIGALAIFRLPDDAPPDFVRQLYNAFSALAFLPFPYDSVLAALPVADAAYWKKTEPDPTYHVRLDALPSPGGEADLGALVERLHSRPLDLTRPLWEAHLIEGLENNRFAFYFKAHHCATDGIAAVQTIQSWLSTDPGGALPSGGKVDESGDLSLLQKLTILPRRIVEGTLATAGMLPNLARMALGPDSFVRTAVRTPSSVFNQRLGPHRRVAVERMSLATLKEVAGRTDTKVNDVVLAVVGGAVHRYLLELDALPRTSLTASVPMALSRTEDTLNAATGFVTPLGTELDDPLARLQLVAAHTRRGKHDIDGLSRGAQDYFALLGLTPLLLAQNARLATRLPLLFNFTVSNVVLGKEKRYLMGAELEYIVPISFLVDGYGLNVTVIGYGDSVTLGFVGDRDSLPHLQRLADYTRAALADLVEAAGSAGQ